jgi:hypothetical protein
MSAIDVIILAVALTPIALTLIRRRKRKAAEILRRARMRLLFGDSSRHA